MVELNAFPSSQRRGGCAERSEGADGVVSSGKYFGRTPIEASPYRARAARHPSSARRGICHQRIYSFYDRCYSLALPWLIAAFTTTVTFAAPADDLRLIDAVKSSDRAAVRSLIEKRGDVNAAQPDGTTAVAWAANRDDLETADFLIRAGANVNAANEYGVTPLALACTNRSSRMVERLLKAGANPNARQWTGETPLMICARTGNAETVKLLLSYEANPNASDTYGVTALHYAIPRGIAGIDSVSVVFRPYQEVPPDMQKLVKSLIAHKANPNATIAKDFPPYSRSPYALQTSLVGVTPFLLAAAAADVGLIRTLLEAGADPQMKARDGATALMMAAGVGRIDERENEQEEANAVEAAKLALMLGNDINAP